MTTIYKISGAYPCWHAHQYDDNGKIVYSNHHSDPDMCIREVASYYKLTQGVNLNNQSDEWTRKHSELKVVHDTIQHTNTDEWIRQHSELEDSI